MKREIITIENGMVSIPKSADIWMTQYQLADLFDCFVSKIQANVRAILKSGVLDETEVCRRYYFGNGSFVEQHNLEMITALAFRIKSGNAEIFRDWLLRKMATDANPRPVLMIGSRSKSMFPLN